MTVLLIAAACGQACKVVVSNQPVIAHQAYVAPVQAVASISYGHAFHAPYYTAAALAYKVEDPERAALVRQNEKLTDALVTELAESKRKVERLESSIAATGDPAGEPQRQTERPAAAEILKRNCASCHSGDKAKGGFTLGAKPRLSERLLINHVVNGEDASMPPKDKKQLTAEERKVIADWAVVTKAELKADALQASK